MQLCSGGPVAKTGEAETEQGVDKPMGKPDRLRPKTPRSSNVPATFFLTTERLYTGATCCMPLCMPPQMTRWGGGKGLL